MTHIRVTHKYFVVACFVVAFVAMFESAVEADEVQLMAGAAENRITPVMKGRGVYEDLYARALVISDGRQKVAIVTLDLGGLSPVAFADKVRKVIERATGIPSDNLAVNCSHTHNAHWPEDEQWLKEKQPSTAELKIDYDAWLKGVEFQTGYTRWLIGHIAEVVKRAAENLQPALLRVGREPAQVGFNRRMMKSDGYITMTPNPNGAVVPWVDVLDVLKAKPEKPGQRHRRIALLISHAAHPVIVHASSEKIGPDFPGFAVKHLKRMLPADRPGGVVMFAQGCGGNINGQPLRGGIHAADAAGMLLAQAAMRSLEDIKLVKSAKIRVASSGIR